MKIDDTDPVDSQSAIDRAIDRIRAKLLPGGPAVDRLAVCAFIAGALPEADAQQIRELITTYMDWNDCYWEARAAEEAITIERTRDGVARLNWLQADLKLESTKPFEVINWLATLAVSICRQAGLTPWTTALRGSHHAEADPIPLEGSIRDELCRHHRLVLADEGHWLQLSEVSGAIILEMKESPARPLGEFQLEFWCAQSLLMTFRGSDRVSIQPDQLSQLMEQGADRVVVQRHSQPEDAPE